MERPTPVNKEREVPEDRFLVSKTDPRGVITYANEVFCEVAGYTEEELVGKPHNVVRHPEMPRIVFKLLWDTIKQGKEFWGYVKNMAKDGSYYWVYAHVTPSWDESGTRIIGYQSDRRRANKEAVRNIEEIYKKLLEAERFGGMQASEKLLQEVLKGMPYEEWIWTLWRE